MSSEGPRLSDLKRIGEGREAEIFAWGEGSILRLMREPGSGDRADQQLDAMTTAWEAGVPVPAPGRRIDVEGRPGIVMERVAGPDLLTLMGRRPWTVPWVAKTLGTVHASMHEVIGPSSLPTLRESLRERIIAAPALPEDVRARSLRVLEDLPDGDRLCHGDFHPGNLLRSPRGPVAIDWTLVSRGEPTGDFARQPLMLTLGEVPPGTHPVVRYGERYGRGIFLRLYMRTYKRLRPVDDANWSRWQVVQAAARFAERIESEYPALLRFLEAQIAS